MARYLLTRLTALVGIVFIISFFCFLLMHLLPGDPAESILGYSYTAAAGRHYDLTHGLTGPLLGQYWYWLRHVLHGDLGIASPSGQPVSTLIGQAFRIDLELIILSQIMAFLIAIPLAVYGSRRPGRFFDNASGSVAFMFYCLPAFILVVWLTELLTVHFQIFPGPATNPYPSGVPLISEAWTNLQVMFLPSLIVAIGSVAIYYRLLRNEMGVTLQEDFITVARSKGMTTNRILWGQALRPSSVPMLASTGNNVALLITGLFIVELKFQLPGLGFDLVTGLPQKDYLLVQGIALVSAIVVVVVNFAIDIITTLVDPRIARA